MLHVTCYIYIRNALHNVLRWMDLLLSSMMSLPGEANLGQGFLYMVHWRPLGSTDSLRTLRVRLNMEAEGLQSMIPKFNPGPGGPEFCCLSSHLYQDLTVHYLNHPLPLLASHHTHLPPVPRKHSWDVLLQDVVPLLATRGLD